MRRRRFIHQHSMVYVLWASRTLQDTIDVLKAAKGTIHDTRRITTSERSDGNVARSIQLAENQVEAAFISLRVRPSLLFNGSTTSTALYHRVNQDLPMRHKTHKYVYSALPVMILC
jgi:hypothetical protein